MIELIAYWKCARATQQAVMTVGKWHRNQIIGGLWLLAQKNLRWIHAYVVQF
jgi:hypothetical protein